MAEDDEAFEVAPEEPALTVNRAAAEGNVSLLKRLLAEGASANDLSERGIPALHQAGRMGQLECIDALLKAGADVALKDTCTDIYALDSDEQGWRFSGSLALHWAAYFGHGEAVKMLLDHGSPVDTVDDGRSTALQAAAHTGHAEAAEMIIAAGADVNAADERGWTPLHSAARYGRFQCVELLVQNGALMNIPDEDGETPVQIADDCNRRFTAALLLSHGAALPETLVPSCGPLYCKKLLGLASTLAGARVEALCGEITTGASKPNALLRCRLSLERWLQARLTAEAVAAPGTAADASSGAAAGAGAGDASAAVAPVEAEPDVTIPRRGAPPAAEVEELTLLQAKRRGSADPHACFRLCTAHWTQPQPPAWQLAKPLSLSASQRHIGQGLAPQYWGWEREMGDLPDLDLHTLLQPSRRVACAELRLECAKLARADAAERSLQLLSELVAQLRGGRGTAPGPSGGPVAGRERDRLLYASARCVGRWGDLIQMCDAAAVDLAAAEAAAGVALATAVAQQQSVPRTVAGVPLTAAERDMTLLMTSPEGNDPGPFYGVWWRRQMTPLWGLVEECISALIRTTASG